MGKSWLDFGQEDRNSSRICDIKEWKCRDETNLYSFHEQCRWKWWVTRPDNDKSKEVHLCVGELSGSWCVWSFLRPEDKSGAIRGRKKLERLVYSRKVLAVKRAGERRCINVVLMPKFGSQSRDMWQDRISMTRVTTANEWQFHVDSCSWTA